MVSLCVVTAVVGVGTDVVGVPLAVGVGVFHSTCGAVVAPSVAVDPPNWGCCRRERRGVPAPSEGGAGTWADGEGSRIRRRLFGCLCEEWWEGGWKVYGGGGALGPSSCLSASSSESLRLTSETGSGASGSRSGSRERSEADADAEAEGERDDEDVLRRKMRASGPNTMAGLQCGLKRLYRAMGAN